MSEPTPFPATGRVIGVDHGTVRIGLAVCDPDRRVATPLHTYKRRTPEKDAEYFARLAVGETAVGWVVGLPLHMSGDEGEKAKECRAFGAWLGTVSGLPVVYHDERYSSAVADEAMVAAGLSPKQRKDKLDKVAAQFILQAYLEAKAVSREAESSEPSAAEHGSPATFPPLEAPPALGSAKPPPRG